LWGPLFLTQAETPAGGLAAIAGPWAITFAIVAVNYSLALAFVRRRAVVALPAIGTVGAAVVLAALAWSPDGGGQRLRVAAIQPGYDTADEELTVLRRFEPETWDLAALDLVADMAPIARAAGEQGARVIAFPEASIYVDPRSEPAVLSRLRRLARTTAATLVVPYFLPDPDRGAAIAITPTGAVSEPRPKQRPMWFLGESSVEAEPLPVEAGALRIGTLLGIDVIETRIAAELADRGADLLISSTHDFPGSTPSHRAYARLAARAAGVALVRADWRYGSAAYTAGGEDAADAGEETRRTAVVADLPRATVATPYRVLGDIPAWTVLAVAAAAWILTAASRRGRNRVRPASHGRRRPGSQSAAGHRGEARLPPSTAARRR
jgi:apolipoprotein N-acyltransferase